MARYPWPRGTGRQQSSDTSTPVAGLDQDSRRRAYTADDTPGRTATLTGAAALPAGRFSQLCGLQPGRQLVVGNLARPANESELGTG